MRDELMAGQSIVVERDAVAAETPLTASGAFAGTSISVTDLWKVFGRRPEAALKLLRDPTNQADEFDGTGCTPAVRGVSLEVSAGEMFVVMGLSGSGKSTLVRCLTRLIEPTAGTVRFGELDVTGAGRRQLRDFRRSQVSMVFQHFGLMPHQSVVENVAYGLRIRGDARRERLDRARKMLSLVGLDGCADRFPEELSGGMKQRVGLARALAVDPSVLLFDEPFSALDPLIRKEMQDEIVRLHRVVGKTMVFITHDLDEALLLGDRIAIMKDGEFVQVGRGEDLVGAPANSYVAGFVRNVARANVLPVRWIMDSPVVTSGTAAAVSVGTLIRDAASIVLASPEPVRVVEYDRVVGVLTRESVLAALAGQPA
ncbi:glycine betaine/L-proline ABC transporter ATP-binding protein (plasmid) [Nocardioides sp. R1-1]|uniref:quaternary amine ABC transporter ATP-binding protein n=1 Tax=Nocardioides sp. R1-1 TaxID=3383502 RepID=UPI0038D11637